MAKTKGLRPGTPAPNSGQYGVRWPQGGATKKEVTAVKGEPLPPTQKPGMKYDLVDRTKNKSGRG
jgi:hypothetical protein